MGQRDLLLGLIDDLYAAPGTRDGWLVFLDHLCIAVNGSGANFISVTARADTNIAATVRTDPRALELYREHWAALDPWGNSPRFASAGPSTVVLGHDLISHSALRETAFYRDFGRSYDIARCVAGIVENGQRVSVLAINGTERRGPFKTEDTALLAGLMPHIQRGLQLHRRLVTSEGLVETLADAVDVTAHAVLLVNADGRVTFMNRAATQLAGKRDGVTIDAGEVRAARDDDTARLRALIADASATSIDHNIGAGGILALGRPSGRRPLMAVVSPISRRQSPFPGIDLASAMLIITDPENVAIPTEEALRLLFDLTPAEAKLTRLLAEGCGLTEAAARLGVTRETLRTRLKSIFEKTNTHRQAELVRLVLNATPRL